MNTNLQTKVLERLLECIEGGDDIELIQEMVEDNNIDINLPMIGYYHLTLLQYSVIYCRYLITKYLINSGAKTDILDCNGNNLLHLLADLNLRNFPRKNIVNFAYNSERLTRLLILWKVDTSAVNKHGFTPFNLAIYTHNTTVIKTLLDYDIGFYKEILLDNKKLDSFKLLVYIYSGIYGDELSQLVRLLMEHPNFDVNKLTEGTPYYLEMLQYCGKECNIIYKLLMKKINKNCVIEEQPRCNVM